MEKKVIAITGGIGSGKSLAANFLRQAGYNAVSCDEITARLYKKRYIKEQVKKIFPDAVKGEKRLFVNKKIIAAQAFRDKDKREKLDALFHPIVIKTAIRKAKRTDKKTAFVEVPLLFESESENAFDGVIVILRDKEKRVDGVKERSGLTEKEILSRINAQFDYDNADLSGYVVIKNDGDKQKLKNSVIKAIKNFE